MQIGKCPILSPKHHALLVLLVVHLDSVIILFKYVIFAPSELML